VSVLTAGRAVAERQAGQAAAGVVSTGGGRDNVCFAAMGAVVQLMDVCDAVVCVALCCLTNCQHCSVVSGSRL
jgi:hypothetical protein